MIAVLGAVFLVACTPKPKSAEPIVEEFFAKVAAGDFSGAAALTDQADKVRQVLEETWSGLQAEAITATIATTDAKETIATATYTLNWQLPKNRSWSTTQK